MYIYYNLYIDKSFLKIYKLYLSNFIIIEKKKGSLKIEAAGA